MKKGIVLSFELVLMIILAVAVLTILLFTFNKQTGFFSDYIDAIRGKSNVDDVVLFCESYVNSGSNFKYCCEKFDVIIDKKNKFYLSCSELKEKGFVAGKIKEMDCSSISCLVE